MRAMLSLHLLRRTLVVRWRPLHTSPHSHSSALSHVHQQQEEEELIDNNAYIRSSYLPEESNQDLITTIPPVDTNYLYATVDHTSQQLSADKYDYVSP